jgi:hypothetical protein
MTVGSWDLERQNKFNWTFQQNPRDQCFRILFIKIIILNNIMLKMLIKREDWKTGITYYLSFCTIHMMIHHANYKSEKRVESDLV